MPTVELSSHRCSPTFMIMIAIDMHDCVDAVYALD